MKNLIRFPRAVAFILCLALTAPSPALAMRDENATEKDPQVLAGLEAALRDPNAAIEKMFHLDSPLGFAIRRLPPPGWRGRS